MYTPISQPFLRLSADQEAMSGLDRGEVVSEDRLESADSSWRSRLLAFCSFCISISQEPL